MLDDEAKSLAKHLGNSGHSEPVVFVRDNTLEVWSEDTPVPKIWNHTLVTHIRKNAFEILAANEV